MENRRPADDLDRQYDERYERYGRQLEQGHQGEFVAISASGEMVLGQTMHEAAQKAAEQFGPGSFLFRIGERAVGHWR